MTFEEKQANLRHLANELLTQLHILFPVGAVVSWKSECYAFTQTGTVVKHEGEKLRVKDDHFDFYSTINVADILRAQL